MGKRRWYHQVTAKAGKYSEPHILTHPQGFHRTACCDCGLVHREVYEAMLVVRKKGKITGYRRIPRSVAVVMRKVMRDVAAMAGKRRSKKHAAVRSALRRGEK